MAVDERKGQGQGLLGLGLSIDKWRL